MKRRCNTRRLAKELSPPERRMRSSTRLFYLPKKVPLFAAILAQLFRYEKGVLVGVPLFLGYASG